MSAAAISDDSRRRRPRNVGIAGVAGSYGGEDRIDRVVETRRKRVISAVVIVTGPPRRIWS